MTLQVARSLSQTSQQYSGKTTSCQQELSTLNGKRAGIDAEYEKIVDELRSGLFCSRCNRSKSQIEKGGENFAQHIRDVKGTVVQAPQQAYDQAHREYLQKINRWQEEVKSKTKDCENLQQQAQDAYNREQQQIAQNNARAQQDAQQRYQQQQAKLEANRQQQQQALQQKIQEQQAKLETDRLRQQQEFSKTVTDYAAQQGVENQQRQQSLQNITQQGSVLAQSIQGNKIDADKITASGLGGSSIFSGVPTYEDILRSQAAQNDGRTRMERLESNLSNIASAVSGKMQRTWTRVTELIPECVTCAWNAEPVRDFVQNMATDHAWKFSIANISNSFPRLGGVLETINTVRPVYDINQSVSHLMDQEMEIIERIANGEDTHEDEIKLNNAMNNVQHTIMGNLPGISGRLYQANRALRSWFDCQNKQP